ncbi:MAG: hypothetical protein OHK0050_41520 [Roseiflexaceae bacterium]
MVDHEQNRHVPLPRLNAPPRMLLIVGMWGLLIGALQLYAWYEMLTPQDVLVRLLPSYRTAGIHPLFFIGLATLSPLLLIPAALLGSLAGICYGPVLGVVYTLIGCNLSALLMYTLGRLSRQEHGRLAQLCARYGPWIQREPLLSVIALRLSFLPYDPINFVVGMLHVRLWPFLLGNTIGSLPGVVLIVLTGHALGYAGTGVGSLPPTTLIAMAVLLAISIGLALVLRQRFTRNQ